jgi:hypothetical protein
VGEGRGMHRHSSYFLKQINFTNLGILERPYISYLMDSGFLRGNIDITVLSGKYPFSLLPSPFSLLPSPFSLLPSPFSFLPFPFSLFLSPFSFLPFPFSLFLSPFSFLPSLYSLILFHFFL